MPPQAHSDRLLDYCDSAAAAVSLIDQAVRFRDGLILALSSYFGLRRKILAEMQIGRHIRISQENMRLVFETSVKNGAVIDAPMPSTLLPYMRTYLAVHRRVLIDDDTENTALWISRDRAPLDYVAFRALFERMGRRLIGRPLTCHSFRYAMATTIMRVDPTNLDVASAALAHRGRGTANLSYDKSGTAASCAVWTRVLERRLRTPRPRS